VSISPSSLIIKPEPNVVAIRFLDFRGSKDTAEMETTEGESRRNSSGTVSVQVDFVEARGIMGMPITIITKIKTKCLFIEIPPTKKRLRLRFTFRLLLNCTTNKPLR
jgi:hypothetical protein